MTDMSGTFPVDASMAANFRLLQDVDVKLTVEIGQTRLTLRELLALGESSVIELDRASNELLDVFVNGTLIGRGEVVTVGERFGVRLTELVSPEKARLMLWSYILKLVVLLPLVCGLMIGCLYLWRRLEGRMTKQQATRMLKVQETMMLSPGLRLAVLEFEGRKLLVSVGKGGVNLIDKSGADRVSHVRRLNTDGPSLFRAPAKAAPRNTGIAKAFLIALAAIALFVALPAFAQAAPAQPTVSAPAPVAAPGVGDAVDRALGQLGGPGAAAATDGAGKAPLSLSLQVLIIMGLLTILPGLLLMMTSFTRIIIVLSLLRQALGLQQTPPNQVLIGLSLFLSLFVMAPTVNQINTQAIQPYAAGQIQGTELISRAGAPLHAFMIKQTRMKDLTMFAQMAKSGPYKNAVDVPYSVLLPAFITSELKTAFQIGFLIFLPFIVIDLVVATVLMSLGMMMMSPTIISMPFKLLLFVLVDGWAMMMGSLAGSFAT